MIDYQHPKWLQKRFEIFERDKYECVACKTSKKELHVHHLYYEKDNEIWDYDNETLITLCKDCHNYVHAPEFKKITNLILLKIIKSNFNYFENGYL